MTKRTKRRHGAVPPVAEGADADAALTSPAAPGEARLRYTVSGLLLALIVVAFVLATRFGALGAKPFHHDESLFATHAWHLYRTGDYDYDPVLHGPFLIDATALVFRVIGDNDATARLCAAVCGALLLVVVWRLRTTLGTLAAFVAVVLLAVSPTLMFFSRFNRNDVPFALAAMTAVLCVVRFFERGRLRYWFLALLAVAWMVVIKETYVVFLFTAATYAIGVALVEALANKPSSLRTAFRRMREADPGFRWGFVLTTVLGVVVGILLIVLLYTTFFRHPEHADGPFEAIAYWASQHEAQRIKGEFHYYLPLLLIYEFLAVGLILWGVARTLRRAAWLRGRIAWGWLAWSVLLLAALWHYRFPPEFENVTHMSRGWHLWLAIQVLVLGATACAVLVTERRRVDAFFLWWTIVSFLAYSYAGEKVPWVSVHIVLPMLVTAAVFVQEIARSVVGGYHAVTEERSAAHETTTLAGALRPLGAYARSEFPRALVSAFVVGGFAATAGVALRLSFVNHANPAERHVYTHTTPDYRAMVADLRDLAARTSDRPLERTQIYIAGDSIWPGLWYFRHWLLRRPKDPPPGVNPNAPGLLPPEGVLRAVPIFILDEYLDPDHNREHALARYPGLLQTHVIRRVPFREWWHQERLHVTVARLFHIWIALVPKQYRYRPLTDGDGEPVGWIGDPGDLPAMTIADAVEASRRAWRVIHDYLVYRFDFDPYRTPYPMRDHMAVLLCVEKRLYKQWSRLGGRHQPARTRFVRHLPRPAEAAGRRLLPRQPIKD